MSKEPAKQCIECRFFFDDAIDLDPVCAHGHQLRFYVPKNSHDKDWGWKRRCDEFNPLKPTNG